MYIRRQVLQGSSQSCRQSNGNYQVESFGDPEYLLELMQVHRHVLLSLDIEVNWHQDHCSFSENAWWLLRYSIHSRHSRLLTRLATETAEIPIACIDYYHGHLLRKARQGQDSGEAYLRQDKEATVKYEQSLLKLGSLRYGQGM